jgi:hypothetical protein
VAVLDQGIINTAPENALLDVNVLPGYEDSGGRMDEVLIKLAREHPRSSFELSLQRENNKTVE